ncbi:MAG: GGDEF domain-containing protein [Burkholderiales bacterium]
MAEALDHVADMTRSRDRDMVDATLVAAFLDLLPVRQAVLWRMVGDSEEGERWQRSIAQSQGDLVAEASLFMDDELLEPQALPAHTRAYREVQVLQEPAQDGCRILLPMASEREVEGVVELISDEVLNAVQLKVAQGVLRIHRNFSSLLDYSERDTLTGLLNRKSFDETFLKATVMETRARGSDLEPERRESQVRRHWMAVIDVDRFKLVNDNFGHLIGDEVLVLVARIMRSTFRYHDRLYRFGGEEFVVLLSAADEAHAGAAFERLRSNLEQFTFPRVGCVTVSVGYTDVRPSDTPQAAFERADRAVYYAKEHGRNQVHSHSALVDSGALDSAADDNIGDVELF